MKLVYLYSCAIVFCGALTSIARADVTAEVSGTVTAVGGACDYDGSSFKCPEGSEIEKRTFGANAMAAGSKANLVKQAELSIKCPKGATFVKAFCPADLHDANGNPQPAPSYTLKCHGDTATSSAADVTTTCIVKCNFPSAELGGASDPLSSLDF